MVLSDGERIIAAHEFRPSAIAVRARRPGGCPADFHFNFKGREVRLNNSGVAFKRRARGGDGLCLLILSLVAFPPSVNSVSCSKRKENSMKTSIAYTRPPAARRSAPFSKSYKPNHVIRIRPTKLCFVFRPVRFGVKPEITVSDCRPEAP